MEHITEETANKLAECFISSRDHIEEFELAMSGLAKTFKDMAYSLFIILIASYTKERDHYYSKLKKSNFINRWYYNMRYKKECDNIVNSYVTIMPKFLGFTQTLSY